MACWLCNPDEYKWVGHGGKCVRRLLDEDNETFVTVPKHSHVPHHLLVVLKSCGDSHREGLVQCGCRDMVALAMMMAKWCSVLGTIGYDTIYSGCYSDEGHVHYHLIPFRFQQDKGFRGSAMQWLGCKEMVSDKRAWDKLDDAGKVARVAEIESVVNELVRALSGLKSRCSPTA